jgi:hypothetical protein
VPFAPVVMVVAIDGKKSNGTRKAENNLRLLRSKFLFTTERIRTDAARQRSKSPYRYIFEIKKKVFAAASSRN